MNFRNIVKGLMVAIRNILLFLAGFIAFMWVIALILIVRSDPHCLKSDVHIPDEAFMKAVSAWTQKDYTINTEKIRKELEASGLPSDAAAIRKWRYSNGDFYQDWNSQVPDFSSPACCEVKRKPTERLFLYRWIGIKDVVVDIGPRNPNGRLMGGIEFYFDECGNYWFSHIGAPGITVETTQQKDRP